MNTIKNQIVDKDISDVKNYIKNLEQQSHNSAYKNMEEIRGMLEESEPDSKKNNKKKISLSEKIP